MQPDQKKESFGIIAGEHVSERVYMEFERERNKLIKERDAAEGRLAIYRSLTFCLLGLILLAGFLNSCVRH